MGVFGRSWEITKVSFSTVGKDKEMLWFPFLSAIFSGLYSFALLFPTIITQLLDDPNSYGAFDTLEYVFVFLTYLGLAFIATFFNVCVVYTTKIRFEGGNATFGQSLKFAFSKIHLIFMWSLLSATVGLIFYILEQASRGAGKWGRFILDAIRGILGLAWSIMTIFVVPGMVYYDLGPGKAIKKSVATLRETWGESLVRYFSMNLIKFVFGFLGFIACAVGSYFLYLAFDFVGILIGIGIFIVFLIILSLVFGVAESVYNTALFVYADKKSIATGYNSNIMKNGFKEQQYGKKN
ncbi:hypothetical protein NEF87_004753 [Candidatus Lokiarchaeum ossiferum]|uniref:DUF4013 domain-containing protein n=1 Tax=Candidatus Lokiarchaeum ossiferum TaxID=2951803 RepID=A0ABY6HYK0_9ARCH|nr:hypothetical protein NEF87_004753 [Candidatus Lokiarchaeum sp. B-35]